MRRAIRSSSATSLRNASTTPLRPNFRRIKTPLPETPPPSLAFPGVNALQFLGKPAHRPLQFRKILKRRHRFQPQLIFHGGVTRIGRSRWNVRRNPALRSDRDAVADFEVPRHADLPRKDAAVSDACRSREAHLPAKDCVFAHFAGMADQHEIIDLCSAADAR